MTKKLQDFISDAREHYVSKLEEEKKRWGVKCIDIKTIEHYADVLVHSDFWETLRRGLRLKFWIGRIDGESIGLIVSESDVPRPIELLSLYELICDLDAFRGSEDSLINILGSYDGPYKGSDS